MSLPGPGATAPPVGEPTVGDAWAEVVRTAYLLTADHGTAEELAAAVLVRCPRPWSPADLRRLVLTLPTSLTGRLVTRSRGVPEPHDPFVAAYRRLSARRRALLVLRVAEGLDGPAAADVLGLRPDEVRTSTVAALDALRTALPAGADGGPGVELDLGELTPTHDGEGGDPLRQDPVVPRLATLFADLSAAPPVVADPARRVAQASASARRRRRRLTAAVAGVLVAVVASGAVVEQRHERDLAEQQRVERLRAAEAALNPVVQSTDVTTWPTRGNLAGRADLMAEVRAAATPGEVDGEVLAVPFLGEVDGLDIAVLIVTGVDNAENLTRQVVALAGPETQPVTAWQRAVTPFDPGGPDALPAPVLSAAFGGGDEPVRAVVLTVSRGMTVAVSPRPQIDANGVPTRRYTAVRLHNGVGTASWRGALPAALVRVQYGESPPWFRAVTLWQSPDQGRTTTPTVLAASCRGPAFAGLRSNLEGAVQGSAAQMGLLAGEVARVRVVGCRRVAGHALMIVGVRAADGTALQTVLDDAVTADGAIFYESPATSVPRGREVSFPRIVGLAAGGSPSEQARRTVVFAAPGGATAELVRRSPEGSVSTLAKARLAADGVGVATAAAPFDALLEQSPALLYLAVRDPAGRLREVVPVPAADGIGSEELDGPVDPPNDGPGFPHRR